jgi:hypothetical protein
MHNLPDVFEKITNKKIVVLFLFVLLVLFLRLASFFYSTLSWDESLYLLIAKKMFEGHPPYSVVWDNKPPGIYLLFATGLSTFGHSVFSIRLLACIFATLTCFFLYLTGSLIRENGKIIGFLAGCFYALTSAALNEGMSANSETFITLFATAAFYLFSRRLPYRDNFNKQTYLQIFLVGLILGIGFEIKFVVLFDLLPILLILGIAILGHNQGKQKYLTLVKSLLVLGIGFLIPFTIATLYFISIGEAGSYLYANFTANKLRTQGNSFSWHHLSDAVFLTLVPSNPIMWFCLPLATINLLFRKKIDQKEGWIIFATISWSMIVLLAIVTSFSEHLYSHYFLQLHPALSLVSAYILTRLFLPGIGFIRSLSQRKRYVGILVVLAILVFNLGKEPVLLGAKHIYFRYVKGMDNWLDTPAAIAEYISPKIAKDDFIYVADYQPIIYYLANAEMPSRYAYPPFLVIRKDMPNITGVKPLQELDQIMKKRPVYVIRNQRGSYEEAFYTSEALSFLTKLDNYLSKGYLLEKTFTAAGKNIELFRLKSKDDAAKRSQAKTDHTNL